MIPNSIISPELERQRSWNLLPSSWRNTKAQTTDTMPTHHVHNPVPAVRCLTVSDTQQPKDIIWNYQTPRNITDHISFSPADVSNTTAIWTRSNVICYSTDLSEKILPPLHTAEESTRFLLWHGILVASVVYLICWIYCRRTITRGF
jgi:hypothetical protein